LGHNLFKVAEGETIVGVINQEETLERALSWDVRDQKSGVVTGE
jgi:hypothetical protein